MLTARLEVRLPKEGDRARFVELFCEEDFMVFSGGALDAVSASMCFDGMLQRSKEIAFAKQPVAERSTGVIVGYCGVDWFEFEGEQRLELGYRLVPQARGMGYATEASLTVLSIAAQTFHGELLTIIHPDNVASINVTEKLGFVFWKQAEVDGRLRNISRRPVPAPYPGLSARPSPHS